MDKPKEPRPALSALDGIKRSAKSEAQLNDMAVATFGRGAGKDFLQYLRSVTIEMVGGPEITDAQLRHREGARYLVALIEERVARGQKARKQND